MDRFSEPQLSFIDSHSQYVNVAFPEFGSDRVFHRGVPQNGSIRTKARCSSPQFTIC